LDRSLYEKEVLCYEKPVFLPTTAERLYQKSVESPSVIFKRCQHTYLSQMVPMDPYFLTTRNTSAEENGASSVLVRITGVENLWFTVMSQHRALLLLDSFHSHVDNMRTEKGDMGRSQSTMCFFPKLSQNIRDEWPRRVM
jgi:hypothetical protein